MSNLRIIELEQQLKRRDDRMADIEEKIKQLYRYEPDYLGVTAEKNGWLLYRDSVLECFK